MMIIEMKGGQTYLVHPMFILAQIFQAGAVAALAESRKKAKYNCLDSAYSFTCSNQSFMSLWPTDPGVPKGPRQPPQACSLLVRRAHLCTSSRDCRWWSREAIRHLFWVPVPTALSLTTIDLYYSLN